VISDFRPEVEIWQSYDAQSKMSGIILHCAVSLHGFLGLLLQQIRGKKHNLHQFCTSALTTYTADQQY